MKAQKPKPEELNLIKLAQEYADEDKARALLESLRWPNGPVCPHCKNDGQTKPNSKLEPKPESKSAVRAGVYFCGACRQQFSITVGTIFEGSHVPISKWLMAVFIICSSKKSISSKQIERMLGVTYKTAWFMTHRIRHAFGPAANAPKLTGTVEADETFIGGKGEQRTKHARKTPVVALIERGGQVRTQVVANVTQKNLGQCLAECVSSEAVICTDEHPGYKPAGKKFAKHYTVVHSRKQYAKRNPDGSVAHVNTCESFFSLLKRGVVGAWHHVSREHLPKYANEFAFRWNSRGLKDGERMKLAVEMVGGKRLMYRDSSSVGRA